MSPILSELRSAARRLRRTPGFTILATLTLGLGIGATATLFGAVRGVLLRPLPLPRPSELVQLGIRTEDGGAGFAFSPPDFTDLRQEGRSFTEIAAINDASYALSGDGPAEQITAANVTGGYFALLGARPLHGRFLIPGDDVPGNRVVVLGHGLWQRRYRADPAIVGRTIRLDGEPYEVIGVMPRDFVFPETVGMVFGLPLSGFGYGISGYELDGRVLSPEEWDRTSVQIRVVTPGYFRAMGMVLRRGRGFEDVDRPGAPPVTVVSEAAAHLLWPGLIPIGRRFIIGTRLDQGGERVGGEVIGVLANVRERGPAAPIRPTIYVSHAQWPVEFFSVVLRGAAEPTSLVSPVRAALADLDRDLPMFQVRTLEQLAGDAVAQPRLYAVLVGAFAAVALLLAGIGVYGVVAQTVASRTREIGVRLALGASRQVVLGMVFKQGAKLTLAGLGFGLVAAAGASDLITGLLHGVEPVDLWTYGAVAVLLGVVAAVACLAPARRAARLDPGRTLRQG